HRQQALVRDRLGGKLGTYMTITQARTSASWNHKTFAYSTQIGLKNWPLPLVQTMPLWLTRG
ncbi:hypothetical protein K443DRAFT_60754, partial [Laccaria amethystina LaAM-08-1]